MVELQFHPLADEYDLLEGDDFQELCDSIERDGFDKECPIVLYEGKILDGRNRYRACQQVGIAPIYRDYDSLFDGPDPADFVRRRNEARRHDPLTVRQRRRQARKESIAERRKQGESIRTIAEAEGVSKAQVQRDLEESPGVPPPGTPESSPGVPGGGTPETANGKVHGRDGKEYQKKPKKRAKRERDPGDDDAKFDERDERKREAAKPKPPKKDAVGKPIPASQKDVFGDPILPDTISWLQEAHKEVELIIERMKAKVMHYPFVKVKQLYEHLDDASAGLQLAAQTLSDGVPYVVCPSCKGEGCKNCKNAGHFPLWRYEELKAREEFGG